MIPWYVTIIVSIVVGLVLPFLFYRFRVTPWSDAWTYWNAFLVCFSISILVYKYRRPGEGSSAVRTHLINFVISFVGLCLVAALYLLIVLAIEASIEAYSS